MRCLLQALLLWGQMVLFYWYTMTLFWSPATGGVAKTHLRVLIAIKSLYFTFSAMQLRNGYPPPASYRFDFLPECLYTWITACANFVNIAVMYNITTLFPCYVLHVHGG